MYSFNSRVRYSEVNKDGRLKLVSLLDYFQDCSTFHSEDAGDGNGIPGRTGTGMGTEFLADRCHEVSAALRTDHDRDMSLCI